MAKIKQRWTLAVAALLLLAVAVVSNPSTLRWLKRAGTGTAPASDSRKVINVSDSQAFSPSTRAIPSTSNSLQPCAVQRRKAALHMLDGLRVETEPDDAMRHALLLRYANPRSASPSRELQAARRRWPDNVDLAWLSFEFCPADHMCDRKAELAHLLGIEPANAASWVFAMQDAVERKDQASFEQALHKAARAGFYDPRHGAVYVRLQPLLSALPADAGCLAKLDEVVGRSATPRDIADVEAMSAEMAKMLLPFGAISRCRELPRQSPGWQDCMTLLMRVSDGDTLIEQMIGSRLLADLSPEDPRRKQWQERYRRARWLSDAIPGLHARLPEGYAARVWAEGEVDVLQALAIERGQWPPPPDWQPDTH